jgi:hypothetical protein
MRRPAAAIPATSFAYLPYPWRLASRSRQSCSKRLSTTAHTRSRALAVRAQQHVQQRAPHTAGAPNWEDGPALSPHRKQAQVVRDPCCRATPCGRMLHGIAPPRRRILLMAPPPSTALGAFPSHDDCATRTRLPTPTAAVARRPPHKGTTALLSHLPQAHTHYGPPYSAASLTFCCC